MPRLRTLRVDIFRALVVGRGVPIGHPFPDVARHVVRARTRSADSCRPAPCRARISRGVRKEMRARGVERIAPRKALSFEAPARGPLPLGFCGQSHGLAGLLGKPRAIASRIVETHERHRMAFASFGRRAVLPEISAATDGNRIRERPRSAAARERQETGGRSRGQTGHIRRW